MPRGFEGMAIDPIVIEPVDKVVVTMLVDNSYDALMGDMASARRPSIAGGPRVPAAQFEGGTTTPRLVAEHGWHQCNRRNGCV